MGAEKKVAREADLKAHIAADWKTAHGIWGNVKETIVSFTGQFRAYKNAAQNNLTINTYTKIALDAESYDRGGYFDSTTDYDFTAPVAGLYHFTGQVRMSTCQINKNNYIALYKNGSAVTEAYDSSNAAGANMTLRISDTLDLAAGDTITLYVKMGADGAANVVTGAANTFLTGHFVGE